ncbi:MAG: NADH-quinone oxidoreductase subunit [Pseudonocardiales bacterium]|nr:NADH-quinone oxidoreductase subunit [Pseudonocardiales bacterium]
MLQPYLPLVLMMALAGAFAFFSVASAPHTGPRRYNRAKLDAYECGIEPSPHPVVGGGRMPVAYYLTAMLFIATVGFAYVYVWRRGGLDWN